MIHRRLAVAGLRTHEESRTAAKAQIQAKAAEVYRNVLNPIIERKEKRTQELVRELGFGNYVDFSQRYRYVNLRDLVGRCDRFYRPSGAACAIVQPLSSGDGRAERNARFIL